MRYEDFLELLFEGKFVEGTENDDLLFGSFGNDIMDGKDGNDILFGLRGDDLISGGLGDDLLLGGRGNDVLVANKGDDFVFGGRGNDLLVWNNGDGSDLMNGGKGYDRVQVNFDTDLVQEDLQNKDVAEFSVTPDGVQFARIELNDQAINGLFQLDIRNTEVLETNFGGGDDAAKIVDTVLDEIKLKLDGGDGVDLLDFSQAAEAVEVDLSTGRAGSARFKNFEDVTGTDFDDRITGDEGANTIRGGNGNDVMIGGAGADTFVFFASDVGVDFILDFEVGVDTLKFVTDEDLTGRDIVDLLAQSGDDVQFELNGKLITIENTQVSVFTGDEFLIA